MAIKKKLQKRVHKNHLPDPEAIDNSYSIKVLLNSIFITAAPSIVGLCQEQVFLMRSRRGTCSLLTPGPVLTHPTQKNRPLRLLTARDTTRKRKPRPTCRYNQITPVCRLSLYKGGGGVLNLVIPRSASPRFPLRLACVINYVIGVPLPSLIPCRGRAWVRGYHCLL